MVAASCLPLIKINYKYIINFIFMPARRNLFAMTEEKVMTALTVQAHRHTLWHFLPGLALSAAITGLALWLGNIPAVPASALAP
ncbi:Uncharacterised protein [Cedecea neteri]|uniref:Uncharacterized protein n=1 Tax=Cedecea neteri TaxID=158822 RepID=A0A2X3KUF0_9ENTR|nr:Uncharacterised protein [Cedecea neteri]